MFVMTSYIEIGKYLVKPSAVKYRRSVTNYIDSCTISLPKLLYVKTNDLNATVDLKEAKPADLFKEGDKVWVELGYNNKTGLRFTGFIKVINYTDKLDIECEGYSYLLPKEFNASYSSTTVKKILQDLTKGTEIQVSSKIPDVAVKNVRFKNASGRQVLEWIQKEIHLSVFFDFERLYAGFRYGLKNDKKPVKLRINWNTVEDKNFKKRTIDKNLQIKLVDKNSKGEVKKIKSDEKRYSQTQEIKVKSGIADSILKLIANDMQAQKNYQGYEGTLTAFLEPVINTSDVVQVIDAKYPEREGLFFVETIEGKYDSGGGRQTVTLNYYYAN